MIAYNKTWLDNEVAVAEVREAFAEGCISTEERDAAVAQFPSGFYTPNISIRTGLFLLTIIIILLSCGLLSLIFLTAIVDSEKSVAIASVLFGLLCYAFLEGFVTKKNHRESGVDIAFMIASCGFIIAGLNFLFNIGELGNAIIVFTIAAFLTLRFANPLMALVSTISFLAIVFYFLLQMIGGVQATVPFALMIVSAFIYFTSKKIAANTSWRHYRDCLLLTSIVGLICFYLAGNYYMVREASVAFFNLDPSAGIPFGWIFWIFTVIIPLGYIVWGVRKRDPILLRTGLLLVAGIVFTVRYYYEVLPVETLMVIAGVVMILIAYFFIKYLKVPKAGFTSQALSTGSGTRNIEALIIAETLSSQQPSSNQFGGGDFGGGGASGSY